MKKINSENMFKHYLIKKNKREQNLFENLFENSFSEIFIDNLENFRNLIFIIINKIIEFHQLFILLKQNDE